jgi:hypothetical protein
MLSLLMTAPFGVLRIETFANQSRYESHMRVLRYVGQDDPLRLVTEFPTPTPLPLSFFFRQKSLTSLARSDAGRVGYSQYETSAAARG